MARFRVWVLAGLGLVACGDDGSTGTTGAGGADGAGGGTTGAGGEASTTTTGAGGAPVAQCPDLCAQFEAIYDAYGCTLEECNCKEACADLHQAAIDCMPLDSPACSCNAAGELDCENVCDEENMAANACFSAN
jgi:hypothetical protein